MASPRSALPAHKVKSSMALAAAQAPGSPGCQDLTGRREALVGPSHGPLRGACQGRAVLPTLSRRGTQAPGWGGAGRADSRRRAGGSATAETAQAPVLVTERGGSVRQRLTRTRLGRGRARWAFVLVLKEHVVQ